MRPELTRVRSRLVLLVIACSLGVALLGRTLDDEALRLALRVQARLSFALFSVGLASAGLAALLPASTSLLRHRGSLYLAFALSHLVHGGWILLWLRTTPNRLGWNLVDVSGGLAFPVIALLAYAQTEHGRRWLPARARIEACCVVYVWVQFVGFFIDRLLVLERRSLLPWYLVAIGWSLVSAALGWVGRGQARERGLGVAANQRAV
jgi:hypothetical protein